jgi:tetratricopeptide (TPR) repeat protein
MPTEFRKCIPFGDAVRVPSHDVSSLLSLLAPASQPVQLPADPCGFLVCFLMNSTNLALRPTPLGCFKNCAAWIGPTQILCPSKDNWQALYARSVRNHRPAPHPPPNPPPGHPRARFPAKLNRCVGGGPGNLFVALKDGSFVDNATKRQLKKQDQFVALTNAGVHWTEEHRQKTIVGGILAVVAIIAIVAAYSFYQSRSADASTAFGQAMEIYQAPLATTGEPAPGIKTYPDAKTRAAAANTAFQQVASQYGLTTSGRLAQYFVGLTYEDLGQTGPAQQALEKVASSWDSGLASLGKDALADIYQQNGQDAKAIDIYNELSKGKSSTVPADLAQLQLAELYQAQGKTDQARQILALLKDKSKDSNGRPGAAAEIATQKLNPTPAAGAGIPQ